MKILALDTATEGCSVALECDGDRFSRFEHVGNSHGQRLPEMVNSVLTEAKISAGELNALVCGVGPGSFSGVRIAVAYAKGMAAGLGIPLHGISSLALVAQGLFRRHRQELVLAAIDARMDQIYLGLFEVVDSRAQACLPDCVCNPDRIGTILPSFGSRKVVAGGSGWARYESLLLEQLPTGCVQAIDPQALPAAQDALDLVVRIDSAHLSGTMPATPRYLRDRVALTREEQEAVRRSRERNV